MIEKRRPPLKPEAGQAAIAVMKRLRAVIRKMNALPERMKALRREYDAVCNNPDNFKLAKPGTKTRAQQDAWLAAQNRPV